MIYRVDKDGTSTIYIHSIYINHLYTNQTHQSRRNEEDEAELADGPRGHSVYRQYRLFQALRRGWVVRIDNFFLLSRTR